MIIAVAEISQETCSFSSIKAELKDFHENFFCQGDEISCLPSDSGVLGGFIAEIRGRGHEVKGAIATQATSSGCLTDETFYSLKNSLLEGIAKIEPFDVIFISLHGAMMAETIFDTEGDILVAVRGQIGTDRLIAVSLDHHANITPLMVDNSDVIVAFEDQPHELTAAGRKTARVMADLIDCGNLSKSVLVKVPMLAPQDNFLTGGGPMKQWFDLAREIENDEDVLVVSTFPTQPWLDVPNNGWGCLVYASSQSKAQFCAEQLADKVWPLRQEFWKSQRVSISEAIYDANEEKEKLVILSDSGDAVYGGASGDNVSILSEMLKSDLNGSALVPVVDSEVVVKAFDAGIDQQITVKLGGKMCAEFCESVELTVVVKALQPAGEFKIKNRGVTSIGRTALLEIGPVKIAVLETRDAFINHPGLYESLGLDISRAKMVVLKTGSNFQFFNKWPSRLIRVDSPGATQSELRDFNWKNLTHPMYPWDKISDWRQK
ncbi:MAG: M81 family metallopeptidase [candidate division Zixibacteria bacterium]|nr:M81 family metallopeptidase [candidate division Zixibacteria bacterium]